MLTARPLKHGIVDDYIDEEGGKSSGGRGILSVQRRVRRMDRASVESIKVLQALWRSGQERVRGSRGCSKVRVDFAWRRNMPCTKPCVDEFKILPVTVRSSGRMSISRVDRCQSRHQERCQSTEEEEGDSHPHSTYGDGCGRLFRASTGLGVSIGQGDAKADVRKRLAGVNGLSTRRGSSCC